MACLVFSAGAEQPSYESGFVFDPDAESHGHVHASCLIAAPNGDLRAVWYENGPELPPPYFGEQKDKSADVRIGGGRKAAGATAWDTPFVMADTFGVSDNNPCMVIDREGRLWLFYGTLLAVPKVTWGSDLIQYRVSSDYAQPGPPKWEQSNLLVVQPASLEMDPTAVAPADDPKAAFSAKALEVRAKYVGKGPDNPFMSRLGWMPRAHPLLKSDGAILLPLANENSTLACMAFTKDVGQTWTYSNMVPGVGLEQPTVVEYADGAMSAFFRNGHPKNRILRSDSKDGGMTWGPVTLTELPHPGSGIEAVVLANGHLAMIYNDTEKDPRDRLAVSISEDRGETWRWTRHLEMAPGQRFDYPSMIQTPDGCLHASYSYNLKTIKYARFNEAWVQQGD
jgi:predicted neuraminidase